MQTTKLHEVDREILKTSVRQVIELNGCGKKSRKKFKKAVAISIAKSNTLPIHQHMTRETECMNLIEELWKEVVTEYKESK